MASRAVLVGTRGSALALAQTGRVVDLLAGAHPHLTFAPLVVKTEGDVDKSSPLTVIGGRGVFTSGVQEALAAGRVALAVHSAKDLPPREPAGLVLAAFPEREDPRDVLVSRHGVGLADLPRAPRIGTSSRRRALQVRQVRPDARIVDLRGNVDSRLRQAASDDLDAIVLAAAGVIRMGWSDRVTEWMPLDRFLPAPGQGALAVEARADDRPMLDVLVAIDDRDVSVALRAERAFLDALGAGCTTPLGAYAARDGGRWVLRAMLGDESGERVEWIEAPLDEECPEAGAVAAATVLLRRIEQRGVAGRPPDRALANRRAGSELAGPADRGPGDGNAVVPMAGPPSLAGLRVVVTRATEQAGPLVEVLRRHGAEPILLPTIRIAPTADLDSVAERVRATTGGAYDWVVFSSANAVRAVSEVLNRQGIAGFGPGAIRVAAVGRQTAAALEEAGIAVDLVAAPASGEGLVGQLVRLGVAGRRVLYPHGNLARDTIPTGLRAAGAGVDGIEVYRMEPERSFDPSVLARLLAGEVDVVTFASPSGVRGLLTLLDGRPEVLDSTRIVCIGPTTADAATACGLRVDGVASEPGVEGIVAAVAAQSRMGRSGLAGSGAGSAKESGTAWRTT